MYTARIYLISSVRQSETRQLSRSSSSPIFKRTQKDVFFRTKGAFTIVRVLKLCRFVLLSRIHIFYYIDSLLIPRLDVL